MLATQTPSEVATDEPHRRHRRSANACLRRRRFTRATVVSPASTTTATPSKHRRLESLDIQRGLTLALMILVDEIGDAYPAVNHSPWNGITLADVVMPWFLFMVGTSMAFSFKKFRGSADARRRGTRAAVVRALKLYWLGVLLQGGGWLHNYKYGYNHGRRASAAFSSASRGGTSSWRCSSCGCRCRSRARSTPLADHFRLVRAHEEVGGSPGQRRAAHGAAARPSCRRGPRPSPPAQITRLRLGSTAAKTARRAGREATRATAPRSARPRSCAMRGDLNGPACSPRLLRPCHLRAGTAGHVDERAVAQMQLVLAGQVRSAARRPGLVLANMYDPEGALSTVPAVFSVWIGRTSGTSPRPPPARGDHAALGGADGRPHRARARPSVGATPGDHLASPGLLPMNKQLWTFSYALFWRARAAAFMRLVRARDAGAAQMTARAGAGPSRHAPRPAEVHGYECHLGLLLARICDGSTRPALAGPEWREVRAGERLSAACGVQRH